MKRQPNTLDWSRLIHWADAIGKASEMKQNADGSLFHPRRDLTDPRRW